MDQPSETEYELQEAPSEIDRHHVDFEKIRAIVHDVLEPYDDESPRITAFHYQKALKRIRDVVG